MLVNDKNKEKIEEMIKAAEGRATVRLLSYQSIIKSLSEIERTLGIKKKYMDGIKADVDVSAQNFPRAYKYTPESTHFKAVKKSNGWDLQSVYRARTRRENHRYHLELTEEAKAAIISRMQEF